jgi:hypothetical protein
MAASDNNTDFLNDRDRRLIASMGISEEQIREQLEKFEKGPVPVKLVKPAVIGDGIKCFDAAEKERLIDYFSRASASMDIVKFVPASGAATRMFKTLLYFNTDFNTIDAAEVNQKAQDGKAEYIFFNRFFEGLRRRQFAFYDDLKAVMAADGIDLDVLCTQGNFKPAIDYLLNPRGLDYANLPKALIKFHHYGDHSRTALEEHLVEGKQYSRNRAGDVFIHLTISPQFKARIVNHLDSVMERYREPGTRFHLHFSEQKPSTNTIAVDENNSLFRDSDGLPVLRPGGHGALLENLDALQGDIIFIKNIDNLVPDRLKQETYRCKKMLAGHLLEVRSEVFRYLELLSSGTVSAGQLGEISLYAANVLNITFPGGGDGSAMSVEERKQFLLQKLNRPVRVCGMVKNEGEPGGGPFWVKGRDNTDSLQIVEGAQIDMNRETNRQIAAAATHFNPVDLVCSVKDFRGNPFDLTAFTDPETYFIAEKSIDGKHLKALELPGLWNGAMANWITIFVEVPIITFNPIKTVNDLLRPEHLWK